jgi:ethanolamine phosphate phosphodiesterase
LSEFCSNIEARYDHSPRGDISAKGSELTENKWISDIEQFERVLGRYSSLPLHIVLGDKDVGTCANLDGKFVHRRAKHLPGLDSSGSEAFEISNARFVSKCSCPALWKQCFAVWS